MNIRRTKEQKGITLIALVVTIIVLIILAGISISLLFGKSGIITRAKKGQEIADVATAQDKLELIKSEIPMKILDGKDSTVNLNNYLEELNKDKNKKDCDVTNIEKLNDINAEITISGKYKFIAKDEENGNVKIIYLGEAGGLQISPTEATYRYPTAGTFEVINNESQGKLTVKSSNEEIAKASISGTTVTVTPQKMAGTAKIVVTSEANGKYAEGRVTHTAKVENGTILLEAEPYIGEYDGKAHDALISVTVEPKDCKLEYSLNGGKFTEVMPKVTMAADEYTISIKASKEGYTTNAITKTVTINKQTNTNGNLTLSATSGTITYPNNGTFTVTKNTSGGALSVKSNDESIATASISGTTVTVTPKTPSVNEKQVTITVTSAATSNYEAQTATYIATVNMGKITINATAYSGKYDGKAHNALTAVSTNPTGTTIEYSLNGGTYSTTMPQVTGASEYSISIRATKAGYAKAETTKTITVNKQTNTNGNLTLSATSGTITYPNNGTFTVTKNTSEGALSVKSSDESIATASISGTTVTVTPKTPSVNEKQVTITVTSAATSNYEAQTATYVATVKMGTITINATAYSGKYDGKSHPALTAVSTEPTGTTLRYNLDGKGWQTSIPEVTGAGSYTIAIEASKAGYVTANTTKQVIIKEITTSDLKEGNYINYNTGVSSVGTNGVVKCIVLYDETSEYKLQIITEGNVGEEITFGTKDDLNATKDDYNNAIKTLNDEAEKYLNTTYATDTRDVGSLPNIINGKFVNKNSENVGPLKLKVNSNFEGASNLKGGDTNYKIDCTQMDKLNIKRSSGKGGYWLASRGVYEPTDEELSDPDPWKYVSYYIGVEFMQLYGDESNGYLFTISKTGSTSAFSWHWRIRPCFALKTNIKIISGDGTASNPYVME